MVVWSSMVKQKFEDLNVHEEAIRKADVLIEALGYIRKFHGRFTVIKLGGSVMENPEALRALLVDMGRVGEVTEVDVPPIENLCLAGGVPVLPSLAEGDDELLLNVNADTAAA